VLKNLQIKLINITHPKLGGGGMELATVTWAERESKNEYEKKKYSKRHQWWKKG
jgi:hypothetical protein